MTTSKSELINTLMAGKNIRFREVEAKDSEQIVVWRNDSLLGKYITKEPLTLRQQEQFLLEYKKKNDDYYLVGELKVAKKLVGTLAVSNINWATKTGEMARLIVDSGMRIFLGEFCLLYFIFCFEVLHLERLVAHVQSENQASVRLLQRLGFTIQSISEKAWWNGDNVVNLILHREDFFRERDRLEQLVLSARDS